MTLSKRELIGITLWWAEGTKSRRDKRWKSAVSYPIEITNTNPAIIKIFLDFLRYDIRVSEQRIRLQLQIHEGDDQSRLEEYWSKITDIDVSNFNKTIVRPAGNKRGKSIGTCKVRFSDKTIYQLLYEMLHVALNNVYFGKEDILAVYEPGFIRSNLLK